ncbi:MAG: substrate-binding domain-containing protein [Peptococcaceae bacterium]|nr:substrate-binding domain-containing protein [Peptococcaceae bacterium]
MARSLAGFIRGLTLGVLTGGVLAVTVGLTGCIAAGPFEAQKPVSVVSREDGSGTRSTFVDLFDIVEKTPEGGKKDRTTKEAVIANQTGIMMTHIDGNTHSIGYISLGSLNDTVKALEIDGIMPSPAAVKEGNYPVSRSFYVATKGDPTGLTKDFIDFILSAEGQDVVGKGYIALDDSAPAYTGDRPGGRIVIAGSSSVTPVMEKLKEAYQALNTSAVIEIQMTDSSSGMTSAIEGTCDIGMSSRALKESELEDLKPAKIALDGIAIIVNKKNPITSLTQAQVKSIFTGETKRWDAVLL